MKISQITITNFRKLDNCNISFHNQQAIIVGSNNSGKTSAMDCLKFFLGSDTNINTTDFPINKIELINHFLDETKQVKLSDFCPIIIVRLEDIQDLDLPKIKHLIPSLSWNIDEPIAVRLVYEPKDIEELKSLYYEHSELVKKLKEDENYDVNNPPLAESFFGFLEEENNLTKNFTTKAYLINLNSDSHSFHQLDNLPFENIFRVNKIDAQRGFDDLNDSNNSTSDLSTSVGKYYDSHINHKTAPTPEDLKAIKLIQKIESEFNIQIDTDFQPILSELSKLGYPSSSGDPNIKLKSKIDASTILKQNASLTFNVGNLSQSAFEVPEKQNGLGYRNLIFIFFQLLRFRDDWQKKPKMSLNNIIEPIHLVLIEEPEAYLHSQAQQIFTKKFFEILNTEVDEAFTTHAIVSTHSSYVAHEIGFDSLIYLKHKKTEANFPCSVSVDVSTVFSEGTDEIKKTKQFVTRYLRVLHCDLFFADAVIMVEGSAERILIPHFINNKYSKLSSKYISILEVGGAYAHKFKPLIEALDIPTLVITDIDSKEIYHDSASKIRTRKIRPERNKGYQSNCDELTQWLNFDTPDLDKALDLEDSQKIVKNTRIAYQTEVDVEFEKDSDTQKAIPYTFEDALALSNFQHLKELEKKTGMLKRMQKATDEDSLDKACQKMYDIVNDKNSKKAVMALDILYEMDVKELTVPNYIDEGLVWLENQLEPMTGGSNE